MSYLLIKSNNRRSKETAPQRNGRRNPSIPLNRAGGSGPSWRGSSSSSLIQRPGGDSSFARSSIGNRSMGGGGGASNRAGTGMHGNGANGDAVVINRGPTRGGRARGGDTTGGVDDGQLIGTGAV